MELKLEEDTNKKNFEFTRQKSLMVIKEVECNHS